MGLLALLSQVAPSPIQQAHSPIPRLPCCERFRGFAGDFGHPAPNIRRRLVFLDPRQDPDQHAIVDRNFLAHKCSKCPFPSPTNIPLGIPANDRNFEKKGPSTPVRRQRRCLFIVGGLRTSSRVPGLLYAPTEVTH